MSSVRAWSTETGRVIRVGAAAVFLRYGRAVGWRLGDWEWAEGRGWFRWRR